MNGQWVLRDAQIILFNFGMSQIEAQQALVVCREYGFNQIGIIGHPTPTFKYLLKDPKPPIDSRSQRPIVPVTARFQTQETPRRQLFVPGIGPVGYRSTFDHRRLDLRRDQEDWILFDGRGTVARFGRNEREAQSALQILRQFQCSEICRFGGNGFGILLSNGRPPHGSLIGVPARLMHYERLVVRQLGDSWAICEDQRPLFAFGDQEQAARHALAAIQHFKFDTYCQVGAGKMGDLFLMLKTK
jgi:hypothetical protein